jgi:hypothetical protein
MGSSTLLEPQQSIGVRQAAVRTLLYFDVFHHPLRADEIQRYLGMPVADATGLQDDLSALVEEGTLHERDGFFGFGDLDAAIERRRADNARAESACGRRGA